MDDLNDARMRKNIEETNRITRRFLGVVADFLRSEENITPEQYLSAIMNAFGKAKITFFECLIEDRELTIDNALDIYAQIDQAELNYVAHHFHESPILKHMAVRLFEKEGDHSDCPDCTKEELVRKTMEQFK
jgi:hypothetical protein